MIAFMPRSSAVAEQIFSENIGLVMTVLTRMSSRGRPWQDDEWQEYKQAGMMALHRAAQKFRPELGWQFSTYAWTAIVRAIIQARENYHRNEFGRHMTLPLDIEKSGRVIDMRRPVSHRAEFADDREQLRAILNVAMARLNRNEQIIVTMRIMRDPPATLEDIGKVVGLTRERVRQIQRKALAKLRERLEILRCRTGKDEFGIPLANLQAEE